MNVTPYNPGAPRAVDPQLWQVISQILARVNYLLENRANPLARQTGPQIPSVAQVKKLELAIQAVEDQLTQGTAYAGAGALQPVAVTGSVAMGGTTQGLTFGGTSAAVTITVTNAATFRGAIGLGGLATLNPGAAVPDSSVVAGPGYVQADFQSVIDTLNDLLGSLRSAGIIAT